MLVRGLKLSQRTVALLLLGGLLFLRFPWLTGIAAL